MAQALDYGKIKDSCSNLTNLATNIGNTVDTINTAISKIADPAWVGKASEAYRDRIKTLANHLPEANRQLAESIIFLASCADAYDQLDKEAVKKLKNLIGGQEYIDKYDVNSAPDVDLESRYGEEDKGNDNDSNEDKDKDKKPSGTSCGNKGCSGCGNKGCGGCGGGQTQYPSVAYSVGPEPATTPVPEDIQSSIKELDYDAISLDDADENTKYLFKHEKFKYKDGYAMIDDYYLIACGDEVGKIGDIITITKKDGTTVKCLVAANLKDEKDKNKVVFIVNKDQLKAIKEKDDFKDLLKDATKIEKFGDCKSTLGISLPESTVDLGDIDMTNYPRDVYDKEAQLTRGTLVAKYLMKNGGFTAEQAAALVGVYIDENGCYPGDIPGSVKSTEQQYLGSNGYGAGIGSWTTVEVKQMVLKDAGFDPNTPIESLTLQQQCDLIIGTSQKSMKTYYDALKRCTSIEDASATAVIMTGGVGFSNNWSTHPTPAEAENLSNYYAKANDKTYGYSENHHNCSTRRLNNAKEILNRLK